MTPMPSRTRRPRAPIAAVASVVLVVALVAGCTAAATPAPSPAPSEAASPSPSPSAGPPTTAPSASPSASPATASASPAGQTTTDWGRIWDAVPAGFPVHPDAEATVPTSAVSGAWVLSGTDATADAVTSWYRSALEAAGYRTDAVTGPFEDGSEVIDSIGSSADCKVQTRVEPHADQAMVTILFGAACPFD